MQHINVIGVYILIFALGMTIGGKHGGGEGGGGGGDGGGGEEE